MKTVELLLVQLMEECGEVTQAASKILRFGIDDFHPRDPELTNKRRISQECGDILGMIDMLIADGIIDPDEMFLTKTHRPGKVHKYMEVSIKCGTLEDHT